MRKELKNKRNRDLKIAYNVSMLMAGGAYGAVFMMLIIMTPGAVKWTLMTVMAVAGLLCGSAADRLEEKAVMRCRSWRKNSDSAKNRAA